MPFAATWMDPNILSTVKSDKGKYHMIYLYVDSKKQ